MKSKQDLKDVFNGLSSLLYQSAIVDLSQSTLSITPEYDLPVTVDTLQISQSTTTRLSVLTETGHLPLLSVT